MLPRVDTRPRHKNAPRPAEKSARGFLQWLRGRPCMLAHKGDCEGEGVEAAHVPHKATKGVGTKSSDRYAVPLCGGPKGHHAEQHRVGWKSFQTKHGFDAETVSGFYWRAWPGRIAWEAKQQ